MPLQKDGGRRRGRSRRLQADPQLRLPYDAGFERPDATPVSAPPSSRERGREADATPPASSREAGVLQFVVNRRARRYVLRLRHDGSLRVTIPRSGNRRQAEEFVERCAAWIARQRERHAERAAAQREAWTDGRLVLWRGRPTRLAVVPCGERVRIALGEVTAEAPAGASVRDALGRACRRRAEQELGPRVRELAAPLALDVARVVVRDQRTRWGSCSRYGSISLNWRLLQMPDEVRDYVIYHELMHLKRADHSRRFWRLVAGVCPWYREAERWLRLHGPQLL